MKISIKSLLKKYNKNNFIEAKKLIFKGVKNKDVYNITSPFIINNEQYILGRIEKRKDHISKIAFFKKIKDHEFIIDKKLPSFNLEDPFINFIGKEIILGGVEVKNRSYRTAFFKGKSVYDLKLYKKGPIGMKDIRLVELKDKKIGIFTRPQGKIGGRGRIGFMIVDSIEDLKNLNDKAFFDAKLLPLNIEEDEWIGANLAFILNKDKIRVIGHIANMKNKCKNYYLIKFDFDYIKNKITGLKIIIRRKDLPKGESKNKELKNILFPGGITREKNKTILYCGASDAEAYEIKLKSIFY